jgi:voltage-gated potassium channel
MPDAEAAGGAGRPEGSDAQGAAPNVESGGDGVSSGGEPSGRLRIGRGLLALAGVLLAYYALPIGDVPSSWDVVFAALGLIAGLAAIVYVALRQVKVMAQYRQGDPSVRLDVLVLLLVIVVPLFAAGYYAVQKGDPDQFAELETKTDALYFTVSTVATVGFGDVHAEGQLARALVTVQMGFDLVFVAALVAVLTGQLRARAAERRPRGPS